MAHIFFPNFYLEVSVLGPLERASLIREKYKQEEMFHSVICSNKKNWMQYNFQVSVGGLLTYDMHLSSETSAVIQCDG